MDERRRFITNWLENDASVAELCRFHGISRKTGYKWLSRFKVGGHSDLEELSRAPRSQPNATPRKLEAAIVAFRQGHPFWGPRKIKSRLERLHPNQCWPASSTIGSLLKRHNLVLPRRRRLRTPLFGAPLTDGLNPNDVWAADFKGWFRTKDGTRIDPLTLTDCASRYLLRCHAVARTTGDSVRGQLTGVFQEFGMPRVLRTDNGVPFATVGLGGLSELSVWLIRLGIAPERIRPAHPQDNGAHERMHRTLKQQTAKPPHANPRAQQRAFDHFREEYNDERPHESLGMKTPAEVYVPSNRAFPRTLPELEYGSGATTRLVADNGTISLKDKLIYLSNALVGERVRLDESENGWCAWFGPVRLGEIDLEKGSVKRPGNKVLPMCPV